MKGGKDILYNKIYKSFQLTPNFLRKLIYLIPIEYRLGGKNFIETYNFLQESERWSIERLRNYQKTKLQFLLEYAVKHVPFYSNIKLTSTNPFKNLEKFPIINKEKIKHNINEFRANNVTEKDTYYVTTGGTSGIALEFYLDNSTFGKEWAFAMSAWRRVGFMPGDKIVSFRGVEFKNADKGVYWQDNSIYNMVEMSPFHMNEENLPKYIEKIKKIKPKYLHGYPSAISILAKYIENENEDFMPLRAILATSENIYPGQRNLIERAFNTRLFSFYGMSEKVIMAPECEYNTRYHAFPEYGITEIADKYGDPVGEGEQGELVGTGFLNNCMPFIRYRTGDYAVLSEQKCKCKRNHLMLEELTGRSSQDLLVGKSGALISMTALYYTAHSNVFRNVYRIQFHQSKPGEVILKIVPKSGSSNKDKKRILDAIYKKVGDDLEIICEEVDKIELTGRGKSELLIQELNCEKWL